MKEFIPEITIASVVLVSLLLYFVSFKPYRRNKRKLLARFRQARLKSLQFQDELRLYILKYNAQNELFYDNITYGDYLKNLNKKHILYLSDKRYKKLRRSPIFITKNYRLLREQEPWLNEAENRLKLISERETA